MQVKITQNVVNVDYHVSRYKKIVAELRTEVAELKEKLVRGGSDASKVKRRFHLLCASIFCAATTLQPSRLLTAVGLASHLPLQQRASSAKIAPFRKALTEIFTERNNIIAQIVAKEVGLGCSGGRCLSFHGTARSA